MGDSIDERLGLVSCPVVPELSDVVEGRLDVQQRGRERNALSGRRRSS